MAPPPVPSEEDLLQELSVEEKSAMVGLPPPGPYRPGITKIRYSHDAMIDIIVENPWIHQNQLANHFGYTPGWISTVMATDLFQAKLEERRREIIDPELRASIEERFKAVVTQSLRVLQEKLSQPVSQVPDQLALRAAELGARAAGIGGFGRDIAPPPPPANPDYLNQLASRLIELQGNIRRRTENVEDATIVREG